LSAWCAAVAKETRLKVAKSGQKWPKVAKSTAKSRAKTKAKLRLNVRLTGPYVSC
jgi:hypothetical protein